MTTHSDQATSRRTVLRAGMVLGAAGALGTAGLAGAPAADAAPAARRGRLPYPDVADTSHATPEVAHIVTAFFAAKSRHQPEAMVSFFAPAPTPVVYIDAGLGVTWPSQASLVHLPIGTLGPYPTDFRDSHGPVAPAVRRAATRLQAAFAASDASGAAQLFTPDAVFEDMALHTRVEGPLQIQRYLSRGLAQLPYGVGASVADVVGSERGGGYEWHASAGAAPLQRGNVILELDGSGQISRFTTIYDSFQFPDAQYRALAGLNAET
jgi:hypothetical protein